MNNYKLLAYIAFSAVVSNSAIAQDTIWVRKNAPTIKETYSVSFSADGEKVFSGSECSPAYLRIFNAATGNVTWDYELGGTLLCVSGVKLSSDGLKAAAMEEMGNLLIFDYTGATPSLISTVNTGTYGAFALDFSPDGTRIVTGCTDKLMNIYRVADGVQLHSTIAHTSWVMSVDWSPNGTMIATGGSDNLIKLWDTAGVLIRTLTGHTGSVQSVKFSEDGNYLVSGSKDDKIKIWDVATGTVVRTISGHKNDVMQVDVSADGSKIASGSTDSTIRIWNWNTGTQLQSFRLANAGKVYSVCFAPNNHFLAAGTSNGDVQLWDINLTTEIKETATNKTLLYPNPTDGKVYINTDGDADKITVIDIMGKLVDQRRITEKLICVDLTGMPEGMYMISLLHKNGKVQQLKVMKQP